MSAEDENLGPLVRLWGLRTEQLPAPSATTADSAPFLIAVLQEAVPFIDAVAPKDGTARPSEWKAKGTKSYPESTAQVELYERVIPAAELEKEAARNSLSNGVDAPETWACRRSIHKDRPSKGTAAWEEFVKCFKDDHVEAEKAFTPNVMEAREALAWDCAGVAVEEGGSTWDDFRVGVFEIKHKLGMPLKNRVFPELIITAKAREADEFIVVSIPMADLDKADYGGLVKEKGIVMAAYVSVERVRKTPTGAIEWIMATASDAKGVLPAWIQARAVLGVVAKDVALFLGWIAEEREKGTSVGKWTAVKGNRTDPNRRASTTLEDGESSSQGRNSRQGVSSRHGKEPAATTFPLTFGIQKLLSYIPVANPRFVQQFNQNERDLSRQTNGNGSNDILFHAGKTSPFQSFVGLAPGNGPIVPDTLLYYNLYDQLWKQRQKQEDFEKRLDTSEKEKEEFRITFQAELNALEKQLKGQTSAFMKKLRQSEERLEARLDAMQRQLDTQKATQNANAETVQHDIRYLQRNLDLRSGQQTAPAPALPVVRDLKRPITTAVKRRKEDELSPVVDLDTRGHPQSSPPKPTQTRSKTRPKQSVSGNSGEKASKTRMEEFRQHQKDAHDAYLQLKSTNFNAVRAFVYKFIENISDFEISQKFQLELLTRIRNRYIQAFPYYIFLNMPDISAPPPPPRPKLKLKASFSEPNGAPATPSVSTPLSTTKIKLKPSQPPTPASTDTPKPVKTKAGRQPKPTSKLIESKKREQDEIDDDGLSRSAKKIKLLKTPTVSTPGNRHIVVKAKGKPPVHPPGDGYDSEASDQEKDPVIEEQFILRMMPGEHCEYVRKCIEEGKVGVARKDGGADIAIKFIEDESRRALVIVKGQHYAAVMVELPTITEGMKSWDRKTFMKSADICHMLLVFQQVKSEDEARKVPLPPMIQPGFKWPHGLTPPMHDAANQRFAKVISRSEIELKENEVKKLLAADAAAVSSKYELIDENKPTYEEYSEDEQDADGEADDSGYFPAEGYANGELFDDDLEAELEAAFEEEMNQPTTEVGTPATHKKEAEMATISNKILRGRVESRLKDLKAELHLKMTSIGEEEEDED
ncbi:transcription initiation factor tfiid subunit 7 [Colletotrichum asianum]